MIRVQNLSQGLQIEKNKGKYKKGPGACPSHGPVFLDDPITLLLGYSNRVKLKS